MTTSLHRAEHRQLPVLKKISNYPTSAKCGNSANICYISRLYHLVPPFPEWFAMMTYIPAIEARCRSQTMVVRSSDCKALRSTIHHFIERAAPAAAAAAAAAAAVSPAPRPFADNWITTATVRFTFVGSLMRWSSWEMQFKHPVMLRTTTYRSRITVHALCVDAATSLRVLLQILKVAA